MALTSVDRLVLIPGLANKNPAWLAELVQSASSAIKDYCKRDLEQAPYTEFYNGTDRPELVLRQRPVLLTGLAVYYDAQGNYGQTSGAFASGTLLTLGTDYALELDAGGTESTRGILRKIGMGGAGWPFWYPGFAGGRLSASKLAGWPLGYGNLKVTYTAGYDPIPASITQAADQLVTWFVRNTPSGAVLQSESLGAYSYSVMQQSLPGAPELGSTRQLLGRYRETAWPAL